MGSSSPAADPCFHHHTGYGATTRRPDPAHHGESTISFDATLWKIPNFLAPLSFIQGIPRLTSVLLSCFNPIRLKHMKSPPSKADAVLHELAQSARSNGDSKSVFGLLLLIEREIRSEGQRKMSQVAPPDSKNLQNRRGSTIFRGYVE